MTIDDALRAYASGYRSAKETKDRTGLGYVQVLEAVMDLEAGLIHPVLNEHLPQAVSV